MNSLRLLSAFCLSVVFFPGCRKNNSSSDTDYSGSRLQSVTTQTIANETTYFRIFYHDTLNRLTSVLDSMRFRTDNNYFASSSMPTSIEYNVQGRVKQITGRYRLLNDAIYDVWQYNSEGLPQTSRHISELEQDTVVHFYTYDSLKRLVKDSLADNKRKSLVEYIMHTYDSRDNIVEWNSFSNASGVLQNVLKIQVTYDDNPNPYRTLGSTVFTSWYERIGISKNNPLQVVYTNGIRETYQYQYYSNGLPKSAVVTSTSMQSGGNRKITYKYEL